MGKLVPKGVGQISTERISKVIETMKEKEPSDSTESVVHQVLGYAYPSQVPVRYIPLNVPIPGCTTHSHEKLLLAVNPYDYRQPVLPYPILKRAPEKKLCRST